MAPSYKQRIFGVLVTSCDVLHVRVHVVPSFPPSIFRCHSPGAHSLLCSSRCTSHLHFPAAPQCKQRGLETKNTLENKPKTHVLVTVNVCTILDRTHQTYCRHSSSTTSLDDLAPRSGCLISLPSLQTWHNTNCNSKSGLHSNLSEREPLHFIYCVKG